jgi:hypothetical protein
LAMGLLGVCSKLHENVPPKVKELAKMVHPKYRDLSVEKIERGETREKECTMSMGELEHEIKEWEVKVMLWMRWKLAVPLLYD